MKVEAPKEVLNPKAQLPVQEGPRTDESLMVSGKYEITKDEEFVVDICVRIENGRWTICSSDHADETHSVVFRMWSYEEEINLRKRATTYDQIRQLHMIDRDALDRLKIQRLMKSWSFEKENPRLKLLHVNGVMSDESFNAVMKLHPNILRNILEKMNAILEFNG